jgi:hypothetical protein
VGFTVPRRGKYFRDTRLKFSRASGREKKIPLATMQLQIPCNRRHEMCFIAGRNLNLPRK